MLLPAIENKISKRPGNVPPTHFIPNNDTAFWNCIYNLIARRISLAEPIENSSAMINPYFGRFGFRWHPVAAKPRYFHIGVDIHTSGGTQITAIHNGMFEYSGYAPLNGNYVVISHPDIVTEDGYVLNSIYMHCDSVVHRFNIFQKICRKFISTHPKWANIPINTSDLIATVGGTGVKEGYAPHLHLQFDFISADGRKRVSIDPARALGFNLSPNLTGEIRDLNEFHAFYQSHCNELTEWSKFIESYINP